MNLATSCQFAICGKTIKAPWHCCIKKDFRNFQESLFWGSTIQAIGSKTDHYTERSRRDGRQRQTILDWQVVI